MSIANYGTPRNGRQAGSRRRHAVATGMAYAAHIGRVAALAVALGVGAGLAGFAGTASADTTSEATTVGSEQNSQPDDVTGSMTTADLAGSKSPSVRLNRPGLHLGQVTVRSSGGALVRAVQSAAATPALKEDATPALESDATPAPESDSPPALKADSAPALGFFGQQPPSDPVDDAPIDLPSTAPQLETPAPGRLTRTNTRSPASTQSAATTALPDESDQQPSPITDEISTRVKRAVDDATAAIANTDTFTTSLANVSDAAIPKVDFLNAQVVDTTALTNDPTPRTMDASGADPITHVVSALLTFFGLGPVANTPAAPAAPSLTLLDVLQLAWREFERTFLNQTPTLAYDPTENSLLAAGRIEGNLHPFDPDSATLTYTAGGPANGSVTVNPDGTFTYTPDAGYTGDDSLDVTVSDAGSGFHIHGLSGLLHLVTFGLVGDSGDTYTQHITVQGLPAGIGRTIVLSGLNEPVDFVFVPDGPILPGGDQAEGRILIAEKSGAILVFDRLTTGQLQSEPLITLPVSTAGERGITGIVLDPNYMDNGYIYVSYTSTDNYDQVSRFTVTDPSAEVIKADPDSELVLLVADQPAGDSHHGGGLAFGSDGKLYWAVGDNFYPPNAQDMSTVYGKVLRLNPDSTQPPTDNPFVGMDGINPYIYASGFRNPFRMTVTPEGTLLVGDVGQASWEELDVVTAGGNYGWPFAEGVCPGAGVCTPGSDFGSFVNPVYAYPHATDQFPNGSITSVLFYTGSLLGESYQNKIFIADFTLGWIKVLTCNSDFSSCDSETMFDNQAGTTVKLAQEADGDIYQLTIYPGQLVRIAP